ncbi:ROK family transcriptional regulator [Vibrio sp.]|nr:ROK family transcriptional regulator [Vibrio sp.]
MVIKSAPSIKNINKEAVLNFIYQKRATTQQAIKEYLQLSRPTIIQIIKELEDDGLVEKNGFLESTGGRKASKLCFIQNSKLSIGVEILADRYEIVTLNLFGETIKSQKYICDFVNSNEYYQSLCQSINTYIESEDYGQDNIIGVGIVLQGLISSDGCQVTYGKILNCTGLDISTFKQYLPYQCKFFHDAESAALDELWQSPLLKNAIYIQIRTNMSGAIIVDREFLKGHELKSGVFEHMTIVPNGNLCYCGNRGCLDTYCSTKSLINSFGSLENFFTELRQGNKLAHDIWLEYLHFLAIAINNLHMFMDCDVIIGGTISPYLQGSDLTRLHKYVYENTAFPSEREFIKASRCPGSPISRGPALFYIKEYLSELLGTF